MVPLNKRHRSLLVIALKGTFRSSSSRPPMGSQLGKNVLSYKCNRWDGLFRFLFLLK